MSQQEGPDRLFIALLEEWNERHPGGEALDPRLQEIISRHMTWARTMAAEVVINRIARTIELTPCPDGVIPVKGLLEIIRKVDPSDPNQLITPIKRDYRLKDTVDIIHEPKTNRHEESKR